MDFEEDFKWLIFVLKLYLRCYGLVSCLWMSKQKWNSTLPCNTTAYSQWIFFTDLQNTDS